MPQALGMFSSIDSHSLCNFGMDRTGNIVPNNLFYCCMCSVANQWLSSSKHLDCYKKARILGCNAIMSTERQPTFNMNPKNKANRDIQRKNRLISEVGESKVIPVLN
jgi:hypothetical protein